MRGIAYNLDLNWKMSIEFVAQLNATILKQEFHLEIITDSYLN